MSAKWKGLLAIAAVMAMSSIDSHDAVAQGWNVATVRKTDGPFATASAAFDTVPGTRITFTGREPVVATVSATEIPDCLAVAQIGVRVDGVDYPLKSNDIHTFAGGVAVFRIGLGGATLVNPLPFGTHTAQVILRRIDAACGSARVAAAADLPLNFVIEYSN